MTQDLKGICFLSKETIKAVLKGLPLRPYGEEITQYDIHLKKMKDALWQDFDRMQLVPVNQWQPIETAPKDGTYILLYSEDSNSRTMGVAQFMINSDDATDTAWVQGRMFNEDNEMQCVLFTNPTHWKPLPAAPDVLKTEKES